MTRIPIVSTDEELNRSIGKVCAESLAFSPIVLSDVQSVIEYLKYELPELKIFYFSDRAVNVPAILDIIQQDPWLHYGGIIAIHDKPDEKEILEKIRNTNVVAVIRKAEVSSNFPRLLRILKQNKQILFQRGIQTYLLKGIAGSFIIDNDPFDITVHCNLVTNYLYNANLITKDGKEKLHVALMEMLINAIEHGNCRISFDEKTAWLEKGGDIMSLVKEKNRDPAIAAKHVFFSYSIAPEGSRFTISDEGEGFDWRARLEKKAEIGLHGMGIKMTEIYVRNIGYNEKGNEVSFEIQHQANSSNVIPEIFTHQGETVFHEGDIVVREGEESDFLYYIVSGKVYVYSKGRYVSRLTPDDIFIGEMSFLLSNKRSATIVAKGDCVLIKISKNDFVNLIKQNPHYGIFLARLLAQRLSRLNQRTAKLNEENQKLKASLETKTQA
jgi:CRP-like cAMP-binding protein